MQQSFVFQDIQTVIVNKILTTVLSSEAKFQCFKEFLYQTQSQLGSFPYLMLRHNQFLVFCAWHIVLC